MASCFDNRFIDIKLAGIAEECRDLMYIAERIQERLVDIRETLTRMREPDAER